MPTCEITVSQPVEPLTMPIKVQCNRAVVDPETQQRRACGHAFKVADTLAGKVIRCPKCKQGIQVVDPAKAPAKKTNRPSATVESMDPLAAKSSIMEQAAVTGARQYQKVKVCPECGKPLAGDACRACGHKINRRDNQSIEKIKPKLCGMQLWLCQTIGQALPVKALVLVLHVAVVLIGLLIGGSAIAGMVAQEVSVITGLVLLLMVTAAAVVYLAFAFKSYQFLIQPGAQLAWFQKPLWNLVLGMARSKNWRDYDPRLSNRVVVTADDPRTQDEDVFDLPNVRNAQVVDFGNTQITDAGLRSLYQLKNLECLVLRNTQVTPEEVYRFQQAFPSVWIWS